MVPVHEGRAGVGLYDQGLGDAVLQVIIIEVTSFKTYTEMSQKTEEICGNRPIMLDNYFGIFQKYSYAILLLISFRPEGKVPGEPKNSVFFLGTGRGGGRQTRKKR